MLTFHPGAAGILRAPWFAPAPRPPHPHWFKLRETISNAVSGLTGTRENTLAPRLSVPPAIHWHSAVVVRRLLESPQSIALVLGSADGNPLPSVDPGQFLWISVPTPANDSNDLKYSLWIAPHPDNWHITLRLVDGEPNSEFIGDATNFLTSNLMDGDQLEVGVPSCAPIRRKYLTNSD